MQICHKTSHGRLVDAQKNRKKMECFSLIIKHATFAKVFINHYIIVGLKRMQKVMALL